MVIATQIERAVSEDAVALAGSGLRPVFAFGRLLQGEVDVQERYVR